MITRNDMDSENLAAYYFVVEINGIQTARF
jgi:hypothetical protein